jgi:hypothetical protein
VETGLAIGGLIAGAGGRATGGIGAGAANFGGGGCCGAQGGPTPAGASRETPGVETGGATLGEIEGATGGGPTGRGGCCERAAWGVAGSGVPQKPQNLLPPGNAL